jgi:hypothetical protein
MSIVESFETPAILDNLAAVFFEKRISLVKSRLGYVFGAVLRYARMSAKSPQHLQHPWSVGHKFGVGRDIKHLD